MEQNPCPAGNSSSRSEGSLSFMKPDVSLPVHMSPQLATVPNQINQAHTLTILFN